MLRSADEFDDIYAEEVSAQPPSSQPVPGPPDPAAVESATEVLDAAERAAQAAATDLAAAGDALADTEGLIAVLEFKVDDLAGDDTSKPWQVAATRLELEKAKRAFVRAGERFTRAEDADMAADAAVARAAVALQSALETPAAAPVEPVLRFASLPVFVEDFVLPNCVHRLGEQHAGRWCVRWWEHAEAVTRLEAIWEAFEVMRQQPAPSFSTWLRDHFDSHMRTLTSTVGVFHRCDADKHFHEVKEVWASVPPPTGMFPVDATAMVQPKQIQATPDHRAEEGTTA